MIKIVIFGTGSSAEKLLCELDHKKTEVLYFVDNNSDKHYQFFNGYKVLPPKTLCKEGWDYVIIASQYSNEIMQQLISMNISYGKIIPADYKTHNTCNVIFHEEIIKKISRKKMKSNKKIRIALINYNFSNYQGSALYKNMPEYISSKYEVEIFYEKDLSVLNNFDVICSSHFDGIYNSDHINIELWHGFPIKQMGMMHEQTITNQFLSYQRKTSHYTNLVMSYSRLYSTFFNACFPTDARKIKITGMPRNDLLFTKESRTKLESIISPTYPDSNVIFYMPTWRKGRNSKVDSSSKSLDKLFGFTDENEDVILQMLRDNNLHLIVKLHPYEYDQYKDLAIFKHDRMSLLSEEDLLNHKIHLYELIPSADILITDYSSVYFDTLLIDTKLIFAPIDEDDYSENRGFLLEPYNEFTPGPIVRSFNQLKEELLAYQIEDRYRFERERLRSLVFKYTDDNSSARVWKEIDEYLTSELSE